MKALKFAERVLFGAAAIGTVYSARTGNRRLQLVTKPAAVPVLAARVARAQTLAPGEKGLLVAALIAAGAGDHFMARSHEDRELIKGATSFGVMQVLYSAFLWRRGARPRAATASPRLGAWAAAAVAMALPKPSPVSSVLSVYGGLLSTTSTLAADPVLAPKARVSGGMVVPSADRRTWLAVGALLFSASDLAILIRRNFVTSERVRANLETFVLTSYLASQWLLVEGMTAEE
ncbi:lysoplasmalogenase family protein [Amycolatopsis orientalis]|uniref:lysoplasmalogenase family protein n=1 Tax=Amycolatopsis orientalis TaxID=31958 RepID=UPI00041F3F60|nr:lysoplasmalogenase family protein [Amycolatopsis orientalis]